MLEKERDDILDAFLNLYKAIVEVDLHTKQVYVLKTLEEDQEEICRIEDMISVLFHRLTVESEKEEVRKLLDINYLKQLALEKTEKSLELRFQRANKPFQWIEMKLLYLPKKDDKIYIVFGNTDREHILNSIAEKFVYKNSDYFYYLDLKNDYYIRYSGKEDDDTLPSQEGWGYCAEMIAYAKKYVVSEDLEKVIKCMNPQYAMERLDREGEYCISFGMLNGDKEYRRKEIIFRYCDEENKIALIQRNDITKEYTYKKKQQERFALAKKEANNDGLTGVYNRTGGIRLIERQLREHQDGALLLIDLDNFKMINDRMGHLRGDEVLKNCSLVLKENLRASDIIVRIGGDEFVVFLKDANNRGNVQQCASNLARKMQKTYIYEEKEVAVSASIGIALAPYEGNSFEELYEKADKALYAVKMDGKKGYSFYEDRKDWINV
ncbi:GGDEF domain-containing protein [Blautia sp. Marseille-P3201T]|uniref:GGDEF domain-containing protein n=1 Tax=Blautia sp. Marseille-P3201T TaxID=1907659 RepID=UPI0009316A2E|nr:GGDEF domain-containing protein [Blautia sp. Marseille-P3201T]